MELEFPLTIANLTAHEAEDLAKCMQEQIDSSNYSNEVEIELKMEGITRRGMKAPVPPEIIVAFAKGVGIGVGTLLGKLIVKELKDWVNRNPSTSAIVKLRREEIPLKQFPNDLEHKS